MNQQVAFIRWRILRSLHRYPSPSSFTDGFGITRNNGKRTQMQTQRHDNELAAENCA